MRMLLRNIDTLVPGPGDAPSLSNTCLAIEDGHIAAIGDDGGSFDLVYDANGLDVLPGLVDGHVHPTVGEWTPAQDAQGWVSNYVHGGTTTFISAGELHLPGLPLADLTPRLVKALAILGSEATSTLRPLRARISAGTTLLVPGMTEADFDELFEAGVRLLKYIFYDWDTDPEEHLVYQGWAKTRGMRIKLHSGGVSRSGASRYAGAEVIQRIAPDIVAHISGGPIPVSDPEIAVIVNQMPDTFLEVCTSMNPRSTMVVVEALRRHGSLHRLTLGTDTPGGTGVTPRGMLRAMCFLGGVCDMSATEVIAAATTNTARAHGLDTGRLATGQPADFVVIGAVEGSKADSGLDAISIGDLPGIAQVFIDGMPVLGARSLQTPPTRQPLLVEDQQ